MAALARMLDSGLGWHGSSPLVPLRDGTGEGGLWLRAARLVRTGQSGCYTTSGGNCVAMTQAQFRTRLCSEVSLLLSDCNGASLQFDVQAYPSGFSTASNSSPLVGGTLPTLTAFNVGNACDVVLARAFYTWPVFTPGLRYFLANVGSSYHLLASAAAFRNEPYTTTSGGCS